MALVVSEPVVLDVAVFVAVFVDDAVRDGVAEKLGYVFE